MVTLERVEGMSLESFFEKAHEIGAFEVLEGELVIVPPNTREHNDIVTLLFIALYGYCAARVIGKVVMGGTFALAERPDWVTGSRIPDIMFFRGERLTEYEAQVPDFKQKPYFLAPDLVVEIVSPSDRIHEVFRKVALYLNDGVQAVWVIDPKYRTVTQYRADLTQPAVLPDSVPLEGGELIPGFSMPIKSLFD